MDFLIPSKDQPQTGHDSLHGMIRDMDLKDHSASLRPQHGATALINMRRQDSFIRTICDMDHSSLGPQQRQQRQQRQHGATGSDDYYLGRHFYPISSEYKDLTLVEILNSHADEWLLDDEELDQFMHNVLANDDASIVLPTAPLKQRAHCTKGDHRGSLANTQVTLHDEREEEDEDDTERTEDSLFSEDSFDTQRFRSYQTGQWATRFNELVEYRAIKGHCVVPHTYSDNLSLVRWTKRQRYQYKLLQEGKVSTMTEDRLRALERIGFVWDSHGSTWQERLHVLYQFLVKHKHCNVPSNYHDKRLATWVKCQRRQFKLYKEGKPSSMTRERVQELEDLGFEWEVRPWL
jgi:hypothetical protein